MQEILIDIKTIVTEILTKDLGNILKKIENLQNAVNMINTFEAIKTLNTQIENICIETKQNIISTQVENKSLLNIVITTAEYRYNTAKPLLDKLNISSEEKEKILKFIVIITTAYDHNEYTYFIHSMLGENTMSEINPNLSPDIQSYHKAIQDVIDKFSHIGEEFTKKLIDTNIPSSTLPERVKPKTAQELWVNL